MDKIKIVFPDGNHKELPDLSYDRFSNSVLYVSGFSDMEYDRYLYENGMMEITDLNSATTGKIELVVEHPFRGRVLKFKCIYDSNNDEYFVEEEYFKS